MGSNTKFKKGDKVKYVGDSELLGNHKIYTVKGTCTQYNEPRVIIEGLYEDGSEPENGC